MHEQRDCREASILLKAATALAISASAKNHKTICSSICKQLPTGKLDAVGLQGLLYDQTVFDEVDGMKVGEDPLGLSADFREIAEAMAEYLGLDADVLYSAFVDGDNYVSTIVKLTKKIRSFSDDEFLRFSESILAKSELDHPKSESAIYCLMAIYAAVGITVEAE